MSNRLELIADTGNVGPEEQDRLVKPHHTEPSATVENVYSTPFIAGPGGGEDTTVPDGDWSSQERMTEFLGRRMLPDMDGITIREESVRVPVGTKNVRRLGFKGWFRWGAENWRDYGKFLLLTNLVVNGPINYEPVVSLAADGVEAVQGVKDRVEDRFGIGAVTTECATSTTEIKTKERIITGSVQSSEQSLDQPAGESVGSDRMVKDAIDGMKAALREASDLGDNARVVSVSVRSSSSDEWRSATASGLGQPDTGNETLARDRNQSLIDSLRVEATRSGLEIYEILDETEQTKDYSEAVLDDDYDRLRLINAAEQNGYTIDEALSIYNDPVRRGELDQSLLDTLTELIGNNRGSEISYIVSYAQTVPATTETHCQSSTEPDGRPENQDRDYGLKFYPVPLIPIPIGEVRRRKKTRYKWKTNRELRISNPEHLLLYPEAIQEDGTLIDEAWSMTRKYQNIMRETDRIGKILRLDYKDSDGQDQTLRAMFIDHDPSDESIAMMERTLKKVALMQGGRVGQELDMIAVYPSESAGTGHHDPKKVGLGQDIQYESSVQGLAYPALSLVEMHMPPDIGEEDMSEYAGPEWVLAHEVAGHFTDIKQGADTPERIYKGSEHSAPVYVLPDRWEDSASRLHARAEVDEAQGRGTRWRVFRRLIDAAGKAVSADDYVGTRDPRMQEATVIRRETGHPTRYGGTKSAEYYAETAASEATGITIPFREASDGGEVRKPKQGFVDGYSPSTKAHELIAKRWGAEVDPSRLQVQFADEADLASGMVVWTGAPEDDDRIRRMMNTARMRSVPSTQEMPHFLTGKRI